MNKEELIKKAKEYELNNEWQLALNIYDKKGLVLFTTTKV